MIRDASVTSVKVVVLFLSGPSGSGRKSGVHSHKTYDVLANANRHDSRLRVVILNTIIVKGLRFRVALYNPYIIHPLIPY